MLILIFALTFPAVTFCAENEAYPDPGVIYPVDESALHSDFSGFKSRLGKAVLARDSDYLRSVLTPNVTVSFGGGEGGIKEFFEYWQLPGAASSLWRELERILSLGGRFNGKGRDLEFTAPYVFTHWPKEVGPDWVEAVIGAGVRVRSAPRLDAPVLTLLSYNIVRESWEQDDIPPWRAVQLPDGREGYIHGDYLRSPMDYRIRFVRMDDGRWMISILVGGG